jgi:NAD(P)-dependent dehydrogenase (short-subunit alcohol dehydrogenase family)
MPQAEQVAIVTGSSSGIGFETSLLLARNGFHTCATMRNLEDGSRQITNIIFIVCFVLLYISNKTRR